MFAKKDYFAVSRRKKEFSLPLTPLKNFGYL